MFWIISIIMLLLAVWFVVSALMGKTQLGNSDQNQQNILIAKEQLNDIEKELADGTLDEADYLQRKAELQKALVSNVEESEANQSQQTIPKYALVSVLIVIPLIALPIYSFLGNSNAITAAGKVSQSATDKHTPVMTASMDDLLQNLAAKLEKNPDNVKGWQMLGRSYMSMNRYAEAADVYSKLYTLVGDETSVLLAYADALAMSRDGKISGMPFQLVMAALKQEPDNTTGLWLAGLGYSEKGEYQQAIKSWQQLLPLFAGNIESETKVRNLIASARSRLGEPVVTEIVESKPKEQTASQKSINVSVSLSTEFKNKVKPDDIVFIYAKAHQGPPMPLAAVRKRVKDLPVTVTLDDAMAMMPQMKLSSFSVVDIGARISKSGSAIGQSGDLEGLIKSVSLNKMSEVNIVIDSIK
ncbi:MAG: c-type cytochrome biogenesis protein CcmI [Gammaproteobacteria bacterium]|nr:c-type cytochrome biogenesis protein CcmI [Gammaproteobacteria bacterium]